MTHNETMQISTARQRALLDGLKQLVAERALQESELEAEQTARNKKSILGYREQRNQLTREFESEIGSLRGEYKEMRDDIVNRYETESCSLVQEHETFTSESSETFDGDMEKAKRKYEITREKATEQFEEEKEVPKNKLAQIESRCKNGVAEVEKLKPRRGRG